MLLFEHQVNEEFTYSSEKKKREEESRRKKMSESETVNYNRGRDFFMNEQQR